VVAPITGNNPEKIPMVIEKASFSGVNPSLGSSRNGIRTLFLKGSSILKVIFYKLSFGKECSDYPFRQRYKNAKSDNCKIKDCSGLHNPLRDFNNSVVFYDNWAIIIFIGQFQSLNLYYEIQ